MEIVKCLNSSSRENRKSKKILPMLYVTAALSRRALGLTFTVTCREQLKAWNILMSIAVIIIKVVVFFFFL